MGLWCYGILTFSIFLKTVNSEELLQKTVRVGRPYSTCALATDRDLLVTTISSFV